MTDRPVPQPGLFRVVLVALGLIQLTDGVYAVASPRGFFDDFPAGRGWVEAIPAYNPHLTTDVGALFLATGVLMLISSVRLHPQVVFAALVTWLTFSIPHGIYHAFNAGSLDAGDQAGELTVLGLSVLLPAVLLVLLAKRPRSPRAAPR